MGRAEQCRRSNNKRQTAAGGNRSEALNGCADQIIRMCYEMEKASEEL